MPISMPQPLFFLIHLALAEQAISICSRHEVLCSRWLEGVAVRWPKIHDSHFVPLDRISLSLRKCKVLLHKIIFVLMVPSILFLTARSNIFGA